MAWNPLDTANGLHMTANSKLSSNRSSEKAATTAAKRQKYVTVQEGNFKCTYVIIGETFKVLLSRVMNDKKEKGESTDDKAADTEQTVADAKQQQWQADIEREQQWQLLQYFAVRNACQLQQTGGESPATQSSKQQPYRSVAVAQEV